MRIYGEIMKFTVSHDNLGTHIDWELEGVTAIMIDWFWSNMEKGFVLWHPEQHESLIWTAAPRHGDVRGAIHNAPQTWDDGRRQNIFIRFEFLEEVAPEVRDVIVHEHVIVTAGLGFDDEALRAGIPMGYRLHQWSKSDSGVVGRSSGIGTRRKETVEDGKIWSAHCAQEIGNWEVFLPEIYNLYRVVRDINRNPMTDLSVDGVGRHAVYKSMPLRQ
jgi:hypothetical protein